MSKSNTRNMNGAVAFRAAVAILVIAALAAVVSLALNNGWAGALEGDDVQAQETQRAGEYVPTDVMAEELADAFIPHGSEFGKNETVAVKTDQSGKLDSISVEEWIKNPEGLATIQDASDLQNIVSDDEDVTFEREGDGLVWSTGGGDVVYTGTSNRELPFEITYRYQLDGVDVDPADLADATGELAIHISYQNKTAATVCTGSSSYDVQDPFVMASIVQFDAEHARNVQVDNGTVVDQQGVLMAVGLGMPGLAQTLGVEDMVDLPESVTITADVKGFELPDITTIVTDQALGQVDAEQTDDARGKVSDAIGQLDNIATAVNALAKGNQGIATATGKIAEGQAAMAENLPTATEGIKALAEVASAANKTVAGASEQQAAIAQNAAASAVAQQQALESKQAAVASQQQAGDSLAEVGSLDGALEEQQAALDALRAIDSDTLSEDQQQAVAAAIAGMEAAIESTQASAESMQASVGQAQTALGEAQASLEATGSSLQASIDSLAANEQATQALVQGLGAAAAQTEGLSQGLQNASGGFEKVQEGTQQLSTALDQVSAGAKKLGTAAKKMGNGVEDAISEVQGSIDEKIDLVNALSDYVKSKPAYGGSLSGMPTSTLYVVHAKREATPLR